MTNARAERMAVFQQDPVRTDSLRGRIASVVLLAVAVVAAYANALTTPFQFDDRGTILENPSITRLWPLTIPLQPPAGSGFAVEGRPLLNLTFALNHAVAGVAVPAYHAVNIAIHAAAAVVLFALCRRLLRSPALADRYGGQATALALLGALVWALHPVQTESVTYISQRAESLAGLLTLLSLYAFVRSATDGGARSAAGAVITAFAAVATKETAVVIPVAAWMIDRCLLSGTFATAWKRHGRLHAALLLSWLLLGWLVLRTGSRGGTFAFSDAGAWWRYDLTQCVAVVRYVSLMLWPAAQVFDYGTFAVSWREALPSALVVLAGLAGTAWAWRRRPVYGLCGAWFFCTLAPSSLLPGTIQMIVEHRLYLPLAACLVPVIHLSNALSRRTLGWVTVGLAVPLGVLTMARNHVYASEVALWQDSLVKRPANARAEANLGAALIADGRFEAAVPRLQRALARDPHQAHAQFNLGLCHEAAGRTDEAAAAFARAEQEQPGFPAALFKLSLALAGLGRDDAAIEALQRLTARTPEHAGAHFNLAQLLTRQDRTAEALEHHRRAAELLPGNPEFQLNFAVALARRGDLGPARERLEALVRTHGEIPEAWQNLGNVRLELGQLDEAVAAYTEAIRLRPAYVQAHYNLAHALLRRNEPARAEEHLRRVVALAPDFADAAALLATGLAASPPRDSAGQ